jgi:penicillin-binding protein 1A
MEEPKDYSLPHSTMNRHLDEILFMLKIELVLSKDQILEIFINRMFLGAQSYGFPAAARNYFDKSLADLTLAETALLAGIARAPTSFFTDPKRTKNRQQVVLQRMLEAGFIDEVRYQQAVDEPLVIKRQGWSNGG